ncbi:SLAIN motif-containing protein 2-like isoform X2 [Stegodyphus dumicola]|uniref:SLAIN motif-containing protein 2-like isoform X2 n=1 Tax=Stegodyphus dumicola TaxID=202533 RepID=UPI0015B077B2|nr:SLAIN motif-containing protein 2-like isoform X2 [Stegodyphus dumicola]
MSLVMEDFKPSVSALEVKELQDLVRKLELQNLQLKNKQNLSRKRSVSPLKEIKTVVKYPSRYAKKNSDDKVSVPNSSSVENFRKSGRDEYCDDLEILRISDIDMSDDESWLYTSPKGLTEEQKNESPYKWLRKDVDDPENRQLQLAKKALLTKLNELEILSPSNKGTLQQVENPTISSLRRSQILHKPSLSAQNQDSVRIDTRTFTRSKKKQAIEFLTKLDVINGEKSTDKSILAEQLHRRGSDMSSDSLSSCHVLEDANDVQEVARMQEESLRMSSPLGTPKRGSLNSLSNRKISTSSRGSVSDQDISENSVFGTQSNEQAGYEVIENNSYQIDSLHSDQSSPSESPYGSNASLNNAGKGKVKLSGYRRSLPNLNREPLALRQSKNKPITRGRMSSPSYNKEVERKSDSSVQIGQKNRREFLSPSRLRQPSHQMPPGHSNFDSPSNSQPATTVPRSADSTKLKLHARSGLPRPSRASSATRSSVRSGIPMPSLLNKKHVEDSWSEGCF